MALPRQWPPWAGVSDPWLGRWILDLKHALRTLRAQPGFSSAVALLIGAGLTLGAGIRMASQPGGFDARRLLRFDLPLPETKYCAWR